MPNFQGVWLKGGAKGALDCGGVAGVAMRAKSALQTSRSDEWLCTFSSRGTIDSRLNSPLSICKPSLNRSRSRVPEPSREVRA